MVSRFGTTIICDNVYKDESTKKIVLAGVYAGSIVASAAPVVIRLTIYCEFWADKEGDHQLELRFYVGGKQFAGIKADLAGARPSEAAIVVSTPFDVTFSEPTTFEVRGIIAGGKPKLLLKREFRVNPAIKTTA